MAAALCSAVVTSAALTGGSAAVADSWEHRDAVGDVRAHAYDAELPGFEPDGAVAPGIKNGDLGRTTVRFEASTLRVATSLRALPDFDARWSLRVVTSRGDAFSIQRRSVRSYPVEVVVIRNGDRFTCEGIEVFRTPVGVVADVPRSCLGEPWKVRVGVQTRLYSYVPGQDVERKTLDDALRPGLVREGIPRLSPWVAGG